MGRFTLNKAGVAKVRKMLRNQVAEVQKAFAVNAYSFFVNFGYHKNGGKVDDDIGGWSWYYIANWNCKVGGIDRSVTSPPREYNEVYGRFMPLLDKKKIFSVTPDLICGKRISVTNSVWYGPLLNNGGEDKRLYVEMVEPNRFIEQCLNHLEVLAPTLIKDVEEDCPEI